MGFAGFFSRGRFYSKVVPTFVGDSARALRILYVCVVQHVKILNLFNTQIPPSDMRGRLLLEKVERSTLDFVGWL